VPARVVWNRALAQGLGFHSEIGLVTDAAEQERDTDDAPVAIANRRPPVIDWPFGAIGRDDCVVRGFDDSGSPPAGFVQTNGRWMLAIPS